MTQTVSMEQVRIVIETRGKSSEKKSDKLVLKAIDESLTSFGETVAKVVYLQLRREYDIEREEIPSAIEEFEHAIEEMLGEAAKLIEIRVMMNLHARAKGFLYVPKDERLKFSDYVRAFCCLLENSATL
jgi:hypothetical protein